MFKEPLIVFTLIGAMIFAADQLWLGAPDDGDTLDQIVISENERNILKELFTNQRSREPTELELNNLVEAYIRDQVFYREALALGLDQDDAVVRRRLVQKMEFIFGDVATFVEPTDEELQAHYDTNRDKYRQPGSVELIQLYLNPERHGDVTTAARGMLSALQGVRPDDPAILELGDPIMLPGYVESTTMDQVGRMFGGSFAAGLADVEVNRWVGPVQSGFGTHIVFVLSRSDAYYPELGQIRADLVADFDYKRRTLAKAEAYEKLKQKYDIVIDVNSGSGAQ